MSWPSLDEVRRYEKLELANGRLFVHGIAIALRSHVLEFAHTDSWHCRFTIDSSGAQGLVCGWQRIVHEPSYEVGAYGNYPAYAASCQYGSYVVADDPAGLDPYSGDEESSQPPPVLPSRAFVTMVGMSEYGTIRLVYLSKIESVSVSLDAFELDWAGVELRFQATKTLYEIVHVEDGAGK